MGKSASQKQQVSEYNMSIHSGICVGPIDAITGLYVGEKLAWEGEVTTGGLIAVNAPSLFGGNKDGGGVGGIMVYLPGNPNQIMPPELAARQGLTSATSPAYRGIASVYFIGYDGVPAGGVDTNGTGAIPGGQPPVPPGGTGGDGSGQAGGGGSGCPVPSAPVLMANEDHTGPGSSKPAGLLVPGVDWVWSSHEHTGVWAAYPVTQARLLLADLWKVDDRPLTSGSHLWKWRDGWIRSDAIGTAVEAERPVVALTIGEAHTYTLIGDDGAWWVSHNKVTSPPDDPI